MLFEKPVMIIMDPDSPGQQNNAKKIVDMGAGTFVNGKLVTPTWLEKKIAEDDCCPGPSGGCTRSDQWQENAPGSSSILQTAGKINIVPRS